MLKNILKMSSKEYTKDSEYEICKVLRITNILTLPYNEFSNKAEFEKCTENVVYGIF